MKLLIVDDHPVFRHGSREIIGGNSGFQIVGESSDGSTALRLVLECQADITVVDVDMLRNEDLTRAKCRILKPTAEYPPVRKSPTDCTSARKPVSPSVLPVTGVPSGLEAENLGRLASAIGISTHCRSNIC